MTYADRSNLVSLPTGSGAIQRSSKPSLRRLRISCGHYLAALVLMMITTPLFESVHYGIRLESILMTLVFLSAVFSVSRERNTVAIAIALLVPAVAGIWLRELRPGLLPRGLATAVGTVFIAFVGYQLLRHVLRARRVTGQVLCAAVAAYLTLGICWAEMYEAISLHNPTAFATSTGTPATLTPFDAYYFSFVTLSTVGYGDFVPVAKGARMLAVVESTGGMFYVALLISRLVALYSVTEIPANNGANQSRS